MVKEEFLQTMPEGFRVISSQESMGEGCKIVVGDNIHIPCQCVAFDPNSKAFRALLMDGTDRIFGASEIS